MSFLSVSVSPEIIEGKEGGKVTRRWWQGRCWEVRHHVCEGVIELNTKLPTGNLFNSASTSTETRVCVYVGCVCARMWLSVSESVSWAASVSVSVSVSAHVSMSMFMSMSVSVFACKGMCVCLCACVFVCVYASVCVCVVGGKGCAWRQSTLLCNYSSMCVIRLRERMCDAFYACATAVSVFFCALTLPQYVSYSSCADITHLHACIINTLASSTHLHHDTSPHCSSFLFLIYLFSIFLYFSKMLDVLMRCRTT